MEEMEYCNKYSLRNGRGNLGKYLELGSEKQSNVNWPVPNERLKSVIILPSSMSLIIERAQILRNATRTAC